MESRGPRVFWAVAQIPSVDRVSDRDRKHNRFPKKMVVCLVREMGPRLFFWESQISPRLVKHYSIWPDMYLEDHPI